MTSVREPRVFTESSKEPTDVEFLQGRDGEFVQSTHDGWAINGITGYDWDDVRELEPLRELTTHRISTEVVRSRVLGLITDHARDVSNLTYPVVASDGDETEIAEGLLNSAHIQVIVSWPNS